MEVVGIHCLAYGTPLQVLSVYCTSNMLLALEIGQIIEDTDQFAVICGDFNAHGDWDQMPPNRNGRVLQAAIDSSPSHYIANNGRGTMTTNVTPSAPDITIVTTRLQDRVTWDTGPALSSDHFPVHITIRTPTVETYSPRWQMKKADWEGFGTLLSDTPPPEEPVSLQWAQKIETSILEAAYASIPRRCHPPSPKRSVPWWSADCQSVIDDRNRARRNWQRHPSIPALLRLKRCEAILKRTVKRVKRESWRTFCGTLTTTSTTYTVWKYYRRMAGTGNLQTVPHILDDSGRFQTEGDSAQAFSRYYSTLYAGPRPQTLGIDCGAPQRDIETPFTIEELQLYISILRDTAPGADGLSNIMLKHLPNNTRLVILQLFNHIWTIGDIPSHWKHGVIIPFGKPGRAPGHVENYRPITLLPVLGKLLEKFILRRLQWWLARQRWWNPNQYGGVPGGRAELAINTLVNGAQTAIGKKQVLAVAFLDIEKAFDSLPLQILLTQLNTAALPPRLGNWLLSFLQYRTASIRVGQSMSSTFPIRRGIPQGAVLSPVLYAMGTNTFTSPVAKVTLKYIDDSAVGVQATSIPQAVKKLQQAMPPIEQWLQATGLKNNAEKTVIILFTRKKWQPQKIKVYLNTKLVRVVRSTKYLGMTLDSDLRWRSHINALINTIKSTQAIIQTTARRSWGATRRTQRQLLQALVLSKLRYGAPFYRQAASCHLSRLDTVLHGCVKHMLGVPLSTNTAAIYAEARIPPPHIQRDLQTSLLWLIACTKRETHLPLQEAPGLIPNNCSNGPIVIGQPRVPPKGPWLVNPISSTRQPPLLCKGDTSLNNDIRLATWEESNGILLTIYTDASVRDSLVISGFWCPTAPDLRTFQLPDCTSIYDAELIALRVAFKWLQTFLHDRTPTNVAIYSDSQSAVTSLGTTHSLHIETQTSYIQRVFHDLSTAGHQVNVIWVPSHSGIIGNDEIDRLVSRTGPHPWYADALQVSVLGQRLKRLFRSRWQQEWAQQTTHLATIKPRLLMQVTEDLSDRRAETILTQARTGRLRTNHLRHRWNSETSAQCPHCPLVHTTRHILLECPKTSPLIRAVVPSTVDAGTPPQMYAGLLGVQSHTMGVFPRHLREIAHILLGATEVDTGPSAIG